MTVVITFFYKRPLMKERISVPLISVTMCEMVFLILQIIFLLYKYANKIVILFLTTIIFKRLLIGECCYILVGWTWWLPWDLLLLLLLCASVYVKAAVQMHATEVWSYQERLVQVRYIYIGMHFNFQVFQHTNRWNKTVTVYDYVKCCVM